ncbi:hypothetical protein NLI96_g11726 [Meripilus lineatus]|uniref:Uncharacterized protein n=1 Tax=Meripilus lineatus TaxID=2056292 RepID=A0AAD5UVB9_9APHY|nr:hypothetical protein NLI96_g11726 [Physisporinus lineatus]
MSSRGRSLSRDYTPDRYSRSSSRSRRSVSSERRTEKEGATPRINEHPYWGGIHQNCNECSKHVEHMYQSSHEDPGTEVYVKGRRNRAATDEDKERYIERLERKIDVLEEEHEDWKCRIQEVEAKLKQIDDERPRKEAKRTESRNDRQDERETRRTYRPEEQWRSRGGGRPVVRLPVRNGETTTPLEERISTYAIPPRPTFYYRAEDVPRGREHHTFTGSGYQPQNALTWPPRVEGTEGPRVPPLGGYNEKTRDDALNTKVPPAVFLELNVTTESMITHLSDIANTHFHPQCTAANIILQELRMRMDLNPNAKLHPLEYYVRKYYRGTPPWWKNSWSQIKRSYYERTEKQGKQDIPMVEFRQPGLPHLAVAEFEQWMDILSKDNGPKIPGISRERIAADNGGEILMGMLTMAEWMPLGSICKGLTMIREVLTKVLTEDLVVVDEPVRSRDRISETTLQDHAAVESQINRIHVTKDEKEWIQQWVNAQTHLETANADEEMAPV